MQRFWHSPADTHARELWQKLLVVCKLGDANRNFSSLYPIHEHTDECLNVSEREHQPNWIYLQIMIYIFNGLWECVKDRDRRVAARNYTKSNYNDKMSIDSLWLCRRLEVSNETFSLWSCQCELQIKYTFIWHVIQYKTHSLARSFIPYINMTQCIEHRRFIHCKLFC